MAFLSPVKPALPCAPENIDAFLSEPSAATISFVANLTGRVLVLGAGGKMGLHLCRMLKRASVAAGREMEVVAVSRFTTLRDRSAFEDAGVKTLACDLADPMQVGRLPEAEIIYFLAGLKFGTTSSPELLQTMNVFVPRLVAERFQQSRIVAFSTGCVYPFVPISSRGANETTLVAPVGDYAISCLGRESEFAAGSVRFGTPVVLIRLNYAVEFRYGVLVDIATKVRDGEIIDVTMGHVNVIWQRDAVDQIIRSLSVTASPAVPLNITGPAVLTVRGLAEDFGRLFGRTPQFRGTEAPTAWLNDAKKSHRLLGAPATSLSDMEAWIAAWLQSNGGTWGKPTGFEKRDGKY
jgi:nucleoside-diphosphate-sugar epimerase